MEAESLLLQASDFYSGLSEPNNLAKLAHVRVCFGLAKIATFQAQWENALSHWIVVLDLTQSYGSGQGFTCGMVNLSISYVTSKLDYTDASQKAIRLAKEILDREGWNQHWFAMVVVWRKYLESNG